jgi:lipopolysaccharide transport system permease protein
MRNSRVTWLPDYHREEYRLLKSCCYAIGMSQPKPARTEFPEVGKGISGIRLSYYRDLLRELVVRDMKLRYKRSILGIAWSLLNPLLQLLVFSFVFRFIIPLRIPDYTLFLFSGILMWSWFQASLYSATSTIVENPSLIRQPGFPAGILPLVTVMSNTINFLLALPVLLISVWASGHLPNAAIFALPFVVLVQFVLTLSISYYLAALHVPYRDTQYLLGILLMLGFYLVPIFYNSAAIPARFQPIYRLNPVVGILEGYRAILLHGQMPNLVPLSLTFVISLLVLALGWSVFTRVSYSFIEEL